MVLGRYVAVVAVIVMALIASETRALEWEPRNPLRWTFGGDAGIWVKSVDDDPRGAFGAQVDYYLDRVFSVGPMFLYSGSNDLTQKALAGVVRYHYRTRIVNFVPFTGVGGIMANLKDPDGVRRESKSYYIPLGLTVEYQWTRKLALSVTGIFNIHDLYTVPVDDSRSVTLLIGFRYGGPFSIRGKQ
jgi:hypothetical protein